MESVALKWVEDEILRGLLRKFSRRPWDRFWLNLLGDRLKDLGLKHDLTLVMCYDMSCYFAARSRDATCHRRQLGRELCNFRRHLERRFGYFEHEPSEIPF